MPRLGLFAVLLALSACAEVNGSYYPSCGDVWKLRPDLYGRIFCHMPASSARSEQATRDAIERNDQRRTIRAGVLDAQRAIDAGANP